MTGTPEASWNRIEISVLPVNRSATSLSKSNFLKPDWRLETR
jgi:hypothetical protein